MTLPRAMVIVLPARDEEQLVGACLASIETSINQARDELGWRMPRVQTVLVADNCTDGTTRIARQFEGVTVTEITAGSVGVARATGVRRALAEIGRPLAQTWIANTDADSAVPPNWVAHNLEVARRRYDVLIGTVRPDFNDLTPAEIAVWQSTHIRGLPNGHVHGANLGVRGDRYVAAGGFLPHFEHEDNDLVRRLVLSGASILASDDAEVITSGRKMGRTPGGYAGFLRTSLAPSQLAPTEPTELEPTELAHP